MIFVEIFLCLLNYIHIVILNAVSTRVTETVNENSFY